MAHPQPVAADRKVRALPYCSQQCLFSLKNRTSPDRDCPNFSMHCPWPEHIIVPYHPINQVQFLNSLAIQMEESSDNRRLVLRLIGLKGRIGQLFKVLHQTYGYVFVAKGALHKNAEQLRKEEDIYQNYLGDLQGGAVTVCLGYMKLETPISSPYHKPVWALLIMAWVGVKADENVCNNLSYEIELSSTQVEQAGVFHIQKEKHLLWNEEKQRVMVIDFENDDVRRKDYPFGWALSLSHFFWLQHTESATVWMGISMIDGKKSSKHQQEQCTSKT